MELNNQAVGMRSVSSPLQVKKDGCRKLSLVALTTLHQLNHIAYGLI